MISPEVPRERGANPPSGNDAARDAGESADDQEFVIRQDVRLVRADVQVTQRDRVVTGLTRSDFTLLDEGVKTEITEFGLASDPLDILLLLDVSGSMTAHLYEVSRAAGVALEKLETVDRTGVMVFSKVTKLLNPLTHDREAVVTSLRSLARLPGMGAGTAINASIMSALQVFQTDATQGGFDPRRRRAILILTDNWGLNYKLPDRVVLEALHTESISLHAIVVGRVQKPKGRWGEMIDDDLAEEIDFSPSNIFRLAEETGGDVFLDIKKDQGLAEVLSRIRNRYSLYFKPPPGARQGQFRKITVGLSPEAARTHRRAELRARAGYYAN